MDFELSACPFCGCTRIGVHLRKSGVKSGYQVSCLGCKVRQGTYQDGHKINKGDRYRHDRALVDGDFWGEYRTCTNCIDKWINEINGPEDE